VLKLPLQTEKHVAWSRPLSLLAIKDAARATGATVNDVLTALVAGALGRHLVRHGTASDVCEIHAMVPVDLRPRAAASAGTSRSLDNQFGLVLLALPIGIQDPVARVHAVRERMRALKATPEAKVAHDLLCALGRTPSPARGLAATFFGKKASVVLTNMPGPRQPLTIDGVPLERIVFWVPEAVRIGLGISIFSYAGAVTIGVLADASVVRDPTALAADVEAELAALEPERRRRL
jgi:WS/DGAT/MGAT family acyltransferase